MQTNELTGLNYFLPNSNTSPYLQNHNMIQNNIPTFQLQKFSNQLFNYQNIPPHHQFHDFNSSQSSCISSNSTSDEADEQNLSLINERKHRRMISNRESARRSRMRKQKHLDELWSQVVWLRNENQQLIEKLNHVSENHDQVVQENAKLKEETLELRQMLRDMQIQSPFIPSFSPLEDHINCNSEFLTPDSPNNSISSSMDDLLG
ncbi:basic leucine zipper 4-like [Cicer arietinum]|uniref:Basic leucine zipper 43-like n=1 Tax=Cicer arietinum TaxID=3827 RepID=A0A1S2YN39_CICAR|nr:basic leucine zipper 43-like [Cicer arietinum]